ncbi:hypothetical protein BDA99DRAFT_22025 [Phascolomyces articulosus]|uniref:Mitotic checkpoint regulator, MAD2B-interacting-domain-containing protein n=1 Tax=Phascolomyces articulosus TaxID=60185 RepID=A0AAD5PFC9_9FUNG|nr:hypothetical protein BDA99DRAFT_22025 [Phascolomyces articulosus]
MSLVGNYSSSSDSESSDVETSPKPQLKSTKASGLGSLLPPPKNKQPVSSSASSSTKKSVVYVDLPTVTTQDSDDEEEQEKRAKRQKLAATASDGSKPKGLAALLPPPKRSFNFTKPKVNSGNTTATTSTTTTAASASTSSLKTASSSSNSKLEAESKAELEKEHDDNRELDIVDAPITGGGDESDEGSDQDVSYTGPFFRLGAELKTVPSVPTPSTSSSHRIPARQQNSATKEKGKAIQSHQPQQKQQQQEQQPQQAAVDTYVYSTMDPNAMYSYGSDPSAYYQYYYQQQQQEQERDAGQVANTNEGDLFGDMDDAAITRLTGKRKGRESQIKIKTVNQNDIVASDQDWRTTTPPISTPKFVTNASQVQASGLQKKKNNIMALIGHAQSMRDRLDEQFASGRTAQNEARRKYGF